MDMEYSIIEDRDRKIKLKRENEMAMLTSQIKGIDGMIPIIERDTKELKDKIKKKKKDHKETVSELKRDIKDANDLLDHAILVFKMISKEYSTFTKQAE